MPRFLADSAGGVIVNVSARPRSSRSGVDSVVGDALRVRIKSAPVDGKANKELIETIADCLGVAKSRVKFVSGESSKTKRLLVTGMTADEAFIKIESQLKD